MDWPISGLDQRSSRCIIKVSRLDAHLVNLADIKKATLRVLRLLEDYSGGHVGRREMLLDPILYGYLEGCFGHLSRQHYVHLHGGVNPRRIDFRYGTHNPVVIEFAVRPPGG